MGIILAGCSQEIIFPAPLPTATPAPTATPQPTATPIEFPDWPTPYPTATAFTIIFPTPLPTSTPAPTATAQPTATPFELPTPEPTTAAAPRVSPTFTPIPKPTPFFIDLLDPPVPSVRIREDGVSSTVNWNASTGSLEYQIQEGEPAITLCGVGSELGVCVVGVAWQDWRSANCCAKTIDCSSPRSVRLRAKGFGSKYSEEWGEPSVARSCGLDPNLVNE